MSLSQQRECIVVSVGGSCIVPDDIDMGFLAKLRDLVTRKTAEGLSFYIITGGGKLARRMRDAAVAVTPQVSRDELDWIGIAATRLNAELVRSLFEKHDVPPVILDTAIAPHTDSPIIVAGGVKPGNSSDWAAVMAAKAMGATKLVNLSNIDYVYTADPRTNPNAEKIEHTTWSEFRKLLPIEWDPGLSAPFDPIAAKEAEAMGLEVAVINGQKLDEFEKYLSNKPFIGTVIA